MRTFLGIAIIPLICLGVIILTTALMQESVALDLALVDIGTANIPLTIVTLGGLTNQLTPINAFADGVRYGWTNEAPTLKIVGFDRRFALERVTEIFHGLDRDYIAHIAAEGEIAEVHERVLSAVRSHLALC